MSLPGADELFGSPKRPAPAEPPHVEPEVASAPARIEAPRAGVDPVGDQAEAAGAPGRTSSGRVRHDEKITVYVTSDELHDLEATRLALRRDHGLAVDRGRIVREAIMMALEAVEAQGGESPLVQRLRSR